MNYKVCDKDQMAEKHESEVHEFTKADLKDGMFVRISDGSWGVIVGDLVVCDDGNYVHVSELREDLTWELAGDIEIVLDGPRCFNSAKLLPSKTWVKYIRPGAKI